MIGPQQAWDWLARELDRWGESGQSASFWWRDDDATEPSAELERFTRFATTLGDGLEQYRAKRS